jgi:hypothetical protein
MRKALARLLIVHLALLIPLWAQSDSIEPIPDHILASPNEGWLEIPENDDVAFSERLLYWLPNRLLDLWDIIRFDAGVGPSYGGAIRVTRFLQAGARNFVPGSLRIGALGRRLPIMLETSDEEGFAPLDYNPSAQRDVCTYELGVGLEFLVAGAYLGVCPEEIFDFAGGIFLLDFEHDDLD